MPPYKGPVEPKDPQEKPLDYAGFKALLIESVKKHPAPEVRLPGAIDTGEFGRTAQVALKEQLADPKEGERKYTVILSLDGELLMTNKPAIGTDKEVASRYKVSVEKYPDAPQYNRIEEGAMSIHTHNIDLPPSAQDCSNMVVEQGEGGAVVAAMVATPGVSYLLLRSLEGVDLTKSRVEANEWVKNLEVDSSGRINKLAAMATNSIEYAVKRREVAYSLLRQISAKYRLAVYTSPDGIIYAKTTL